MKTQRIVGFGSYLLGLCLLLPKTSIMVNQALEIVFGSFLSDWIIPLVLILSGLLLIPVYRPPLTYRILAAPLVLFLIFASWRFIVASIAWLPIVILLLTFWGVLETSRRR